MKLLKSLLFCVMVHGIGSYKYYYKRIGNGFDIIYAQHAFGGYQELKSPKSLKINHDSRGERPGICNHGPFFCSVPYQRSATQHFECTSDYQCPRFFKCCQPLCFVHKVCQPALEVEASSTRLPQPTITDIWKTSTNILSPTTSTETHQEVISTEVTESTNTYFTTRESPEPEPEPKLIVEAKTSSEAVEHTSIEPTSRESPETESTETNEISKLAQMEDEISTEFTTRESPELEPEPKLLVEARTSLEAIEHTSIEPSSREPPETESTETDEISKLAQMEDEISTEISTNAEPSRAESPANIQITFSKTTEAELKPKIDEETRTSSELKEQTSTQLPSKEPSLKESSETDEMSKSTQMEEEISANEPPEAVTPVDVQITTSSKITETEPEPKMDVETGTSSEAGKHTSTELAFRETSQTESPKTDEISESTQMGEEISTEISTIAESSRAESPANIQIIYFSKTTETELESKSNAATGTSYEAREQTSTELTFRETPETESTEIDEISKSTKMREETSTEISTNESSETESPENIQIIATSKTTETFSHEIIEPGKETDTSTATEKIGQISTPITLSEPCELESMPTIENSTSTETMAPINIEIFTIKPHEAESPANMEISTASKTTKIFGDKTMKPEKGGPSDTRGKASSAFTSTEPSETKPSLNIETNTSIETTLNNKDLASEIHTNAPHDSESKSGMNSSSETVGWVSTQRTRESTNNTERGTLTEESTTEITTSILSESESPKNKNFNSSSEIKKQTTDGIDTNTERTLNSVYITSSESRKVMTTDVSMKGSTTQLTTELPNNSSLCSNISGTNFTGTAYTSSYITEISSEKPILTVTTELRPDSSGPPTDTKINNSSVQRQEKNIIKTASDDFSISTEETSAKPPVTETSFELNNESSRYTPTVGKSSEIYVTSSSNKKEHITEKNQSYEVKFDEQRKSNMSHADQNDHFEENHVENLTKLSGNETDGIKSTQIVSESEKHRSFSTEENKYRETSSYLTDDEDLVGSGDFYSNNDGSGDFYSDNDGSGDDSGDGSGDDSDIDTETVTSTRKIDETTTEMKKPTTAGIDTNESRARKPTSQSVNNTSSESREGIITNISENYSTDDHQRQEGSTSQIPMSTELPNTSFGSRSPSFTKVPPIESTGTGDTRNTSFHVSEMSSLLSVPLTTQFPSIFSGTPTYIGINSSSIKRSNLDTLEQDPVVGTVLNNTSGIDHEENTIETTEVLETVSDNFSISTEESSDKPPVTETSSKLGNKTSKYIPQEKCSVGESSELNATIPGSDKKQNITEKGQSTEVKFDEQMKANISHIGQYDRFDENNVQNITISSAKETDGINSKKTASESEKSFRKVSESEKHRLLSAETSESLTDDEDLASFSGSGDFYSGSDSSGDGSGNDSGDERFVID